MTSEHLTTVPEAVRKYGLDDATEQRLCRLLRGRHVGRDYHAASGGRPLLYTVADVERAIRFDTAARAKFAPSNDLHSCGVCHKAFISPETLQSHQEREHGGSDDNR